MLCGIFCVTPVDVRWADHEPLPAMAAMAVDCAAQVAGLQTSCTFQSGATFTIAIHVTRPPFGGYTGFQSKLRWADARQKLRSKSDSG